MNKFNISTISGKSYIFESDIEFFDLMHDISRNEFIVIGDDMAIISRNVECVKKMN